MAESRLSFAPVSTGRISEEIVTQIRAALHSGALTPGDRLPSERELTEQFGVSRVTVRDALRILEANGLIEIRVGARGGAYVRAPDAGQFGERLTDMMMLSDLDPGDVTETRLLIEVGSLPLVVARATKRDLEVLDALCDEADAALAAGQPTLELSAAFHSALTACTHNDALALLAETVRDPLLASLETAYSADPGMGVQGWEEHRRIVAAVRSGEAENAADILRAHLTRTARAVDQR